jgi:isoamylase
VRMVLDSLRYWVSEFHIDGFRFDLATTLGRDNGAYEPKSKIFAAIHQDPILNQTKLFAEPWDIGPGGYQLGHFPADWSEWNDKFRDTTRSFWLGLPCSIGEFALRLTGSADLFDRPGRGPLSSVNYVTAHDGFDLVDLVSYSEKHNQENGQGNQDGSNYNLSANFGVEGHTTDPVISAKRRLARRNLFATLVLSHGIPMILGGDELSQGQGGNNNAYAQDNEISWIDWRLDSDKQLFLEFASRVMRLRKSYSSLAPSRYCSSERPALHLPEAVSWHDANGAELTPHAWARQRPRTLMLTSSDSRPRPDEPAILLIVSAEEANLTFRIPPVPGERPMNWFVLLDTSAEDGASETVLTPGMECEIHGPSIIVAEGRNLLPLGGQC